MSSVRCVVESVDFRECRDEVREDIMAIASSDENFPIPWHSSAVDEIN